MKDVVLSLITGAVCGSVFGLFGLPVPAPPVISGLMGIVGLWIGFKIVNG
jgi:XapX domain-containing protein